MTLQVLAAWSSRMIPASPLQERISERIVASFVVFFSSDARTNCGIVFISQERIQQRTGGRLSSFPFFSSEFSLSPSRLEKSSYGRRTSSSSRREVLMAHFPASPFMSRLAGSSGTQKVCETTKSRNRTGGRRWSKSRHTSRCAVQDDTALSVFRETLEHLGRSPSGCSCSRHWLPLFCHQDVDRDELRLALLIEFKQPGADTPAQQQRCQTSFTASASVASRSNSDVRTFLSRWTSNKCFRHLSSTLSEQ